MMLSRIDESVSPCDDFYRFACGRWLNSTVIPDNKVSISTTQYLAESMENQLRILVEEKLNIENPIYFKNIGVMYRSCMNLSKLEELKEQPLLDVLNKIGGWPLAYGAEWLGSQFDWVDQTIMLRKIGLPFNQFFYLSVGLDYRNNTKHIITIGEVKPGIGGRKLMMTKGLNDTTIAAYYKLIFESALHLGAESYSAHKEVIDLFKFHIEILNFTTPQEESRNISKFYNKMNLTELQKIAPNIPWIRLLNSIFNKPILENEQILVYNPNYVTKMDDLIQRTDKRLLANHIISSVVMSSIGYLNSKWRQILDEFLFTMTGRRAEPPRWQTCLKSASSLFIAISALYVRKHFNIESKLKMNEMLTFIHQEFIKSLNHIEWMDSSTQKKAIEKAYAITSHIGYPEELLDNSKIAEVYKELEEYEENQYFTNALKMSKWSINYSNKQLHKPRIKGDWTAYAGAAVVNAYYSPIENAIIFPAGILQGAFFSLDRPNYMNYGAIGTVIGHEITHGFDDIGRQFDKNGNNENWWQHETDVKFREKANCIVDQYSNYVVDQNGMKVNGIITQGENIADNAGVKEAFRAYKQYMQNQLPEPLLPGLKYNAEQLFWLSYANIWCSKIRPEIFKLMVLQGSHSPARFRVIGTLSNLKEFADSFNCSPNSNMNPIKKCTVW